MTTNILNVTINDNGSVFPLRDSMAVNIGFIPTQEFRVTFVTYTPETFVLNCPQSNFRWIDGSSGPSVSVGGAIALSVTVMYNANFNTWDVIAHNLSAGLASRLDRNSLSGNRNEVLLQADANGIITPDGSLSNRFRFVLTQNTKLANPINFANNEHIYLTGYQDATGGRVMTYDTAFMFVGAQVYVPPAAAKAAFLVELRPTLNMQTQLLNWLLWGNPDKNTPSGFGLIGG